MLLETLYGMLDTLANTLDCIEVKGRNNVDGMLGCMGAIDQMKLMILDGIKEQKEKAKEGAEVKDGRSRDIGTDSGNKSKQR